jgi:hypothetical protein
MGDQPRQPRTIELEETGVEEPPRVITVRPMRDSETYNPRCLDCGVDADAINESYMIHDDLWREANPAEAGQLCVGCCERRLGRRLCRKDFRPFMISAFDEGFPVSERLRNRMRPQ